MIFSCPLPKHSLFITMAHRQKLIKSQSKFFRFFFLQFVYNNYKEIKSQCLD